MTATTEAEARPQQQASMPPGAEPAPLPTDAPVDREADLPRIGETLSALREELMHALHERLHLIALECKQVSLNATQMVLLATVAGVMLASAWATVLVGVYMACTSHGMPWGVALLVVLLVNLAGAGAAWLRAHALSDAFTFPATLRMVKRLAGNEPKA